MPEVAPSDKLFCKGALRWNILVGHKIIMEIGDGDTGLIIVCDFIIINAVDRRTIKAER